jgi:BASS family bile acid:Na+ symporter
MIALAAEIGLPLVIVLAMTVVGLELTLTDLARVMHYPAHVAVALAGQLVFLPLLAGALIVLLQPQAAIAGGLILVAAAPQAIVSNYFCLLARADLALSATLTAISNLLALATTPFVASLGFALLLEQDTGISLPAGKVMQQIVIGLLLPIGVGMLVRHLAPAFVQRNRVRFQRVSLGALAILITIVLANEGEATLRQLFSVVLLAVLFTMGALATGFAISRTLSWPRSDTMTMAAAFPARSLSVATLVAVNVLGRLDFLSFAVVFFLVQAALLIPVMIWLRPATAAR